MPKGKSPLHRGTAVYIVIQKKVDELWGQFREDIKQWPNPSKLFEEFELSMEPYGDSRSQRLQKFRTLYNKLTKDKFKLHGELFCFNMFINDDQQNMLTFSYMLTLHPGYDNVDLNARYRASSNPAAPQSPLDPKFFFCSAAHDTRNPAHHVECDNSDEMVDEEEDSEDEEVEEEEYGSEDVSCDD